MIQQHLFAPAVIPQVVGDVLSSGSYSNSDDWPRQQVAEAAIAFRAAGIDVLGTGSFGIVLEHPETDKVVKLAFCPWDGYIDFIDWAEQQHDPEVRKHLPKVYDKAVIDGVHVFVIERLQVLNKAPYGDSVENTYELLRESASDAGLGMDTSLSASTSNTMQREDGTPVFTDPWYRSERPEYEQ